MTSLAKRQAPLWLKQSLRQAASLAGVPGLPTETVLCVRHLTARLDTRALRQAGSLLGTADKLSRQLQHLSADARRPARETVPEGAAAVLFDDPAQMLACAARDWLDGHFSSHWWWRSLVEDSTLAQGVIPLWRMYAAHIPAALADLNARAEEFCRRIAVADAEVLVAQLIGAYALQTHSAARKDWPSLQPELAPDDPRRQLLTLGFSLMNAPVRVRSALAASPSGPSGVRTAAPDAARSEAHQRTPPRTVGFPNSEPPLAATEIRRAAMGIIRERELVQPHGALSPQRPKHTQRLPVQGTDSTLTPRADDRQSDRPAPAQETKTNTGTRDSNVLAISQASAATGPAIPPPTPLANGGQWIETRYGGVLYLLNVAIHLGFYPDFTQPRDTGLALSPWAFLALAGERLTGRRLRHDALWTLLATLAGTDADQPVFTTGASPPPSLPEALRPYLRSQERDAPSPDTWTIWFNQLIPPLRRRLAAALDVLPAQAGRLLCYQHAQIQPRTGRLDAHFNLNDHSIAIRLSGLDRDPGWMPAAGCDIRFIYDE